MHIPIILIDHPTLSHNIGSTARAMLNFGLTKLRIIAPRDGWLNDDAIALAAGAESILYDAMVFDDIQLATADLDWVYATTARPRHINKPVLSVRESMHNKEISHLDNDKIGFLFGSEKSGLPNDAIAICNAIVTIPLNPTFSSINLAQSVIIVAYEYFQMQAQNSFDAQNQSGLDTVAPKQEIYELFNHLENELEMSGYLRVDHKKPIMIQTLRNLFSRMLMSSQEVRTLRGVISSLVNPHGIYSRRPKRQPPDKV